MSKVVELANNELTKAVEEGMFTQDYKDTIIKTLCSLCEDGHSGFSIHMTMSIINTMITALAEDDDEVLKMFQNRVTQSVDDEMVYDSSAILSADKAFRVIKTAGHTKEELIQMTDTLTRLVDWKPLFPIQEDEVNDEGYEMNGQKIYDYERYSGLFKRVYPDGKVEYGDVRMAVGVNIDNEDEYQSGLVDRIAQEIHPIKFPYLPPTFPYRVYEEDFLVNPKYGDYDTAGFFYMIEPDGTRVEINRFFKEDGFEFVEITKEEYEERKKNRYIPEQPEAQE